MSTDKSRELELLVLQFLYEENLGDTAHMLEQESGCFFNMKYFGDQVLAGNLDDADSYLLGFTRIEDNKFSRKIFFQLRKHKYLEALDRKDFSKAVEILVKDLKVFETFNKDIYDELTQLITLENIRENKELSTYGGATSARKTMFQELIKLVVKNPQLNNKLEIQNVEPYRLRYLINQSKNWQHQHWKNQRSNLGTQIPQEVLLVPIAMPAPLQHDAPPSISNSLSLTVYPNPPISHSAAAAGAVNYLPENEGFLTCSRRSLANSTGINYQCVNSENARKRSRIVTVDEV
ncbi:protein TOPLESS-RELATED PROTEIN 2 [Cryptomeria japonica]|uniref:protein TOPLESS-RELATED PROTEIN 2 n=1 Tax=Cryptomeria japonica TaxID=3369 RepID=UPI0025AC2DFE|nr:protein TOPLESS-RELATED PROTEIN 2 [Cryptomeria japonica]